jgi:hypothetical protein
MTASNLAVLVDGVAMDGEEARSLWQRFSDWMEQHRGDLAGFAAKEGFASVHPGVENGKPVLLVSKSAPQRPYAPVKPGGSHSRHGPPNADRSSGGKPKK